jgi:hypothetical protein
VVVVMVEPKVATNSEQVCVRVKLQVVV